MQVHTPFGWEGPRTALSCMHFIQSTARRNDSVSSRGQKRKAGGLDNDWLLARLLEHYVGSQRDTASHLFWVRDSVFYALGKCPNRSAVGTKTQEVSVGFFFLTYAQVQMYVAAYMPSQCLLYSEYSETMRTLKCPHCLRTSNRILKCFRWRKGNLCLQPHFGMCTSFVY